MFGKILLSTLALAGVAGIALGAIGLGSTGSDDTKVERPDCPGKIVCPLTGDEVCKDRCPLIDPNRDDCPGRIECPITGELVCKDRCPVNNTDQPTAVADSAVADSTLRGDVPSCCADRN